MGNEEVDVLGCTGHRPHRLGRYSSAYRKGTLIHIALEYVMERRPSRVISGMALGWDQAIAQAALTLGVPLTAAIPCDDYDKMWSPHLREAYSAIIAQCDKVVVVTPGEYTDYELMFTRNRWVVDNSIRLVAMFDGKNTGGTFRCLEYARMKHVPFENLWDVWEAA